MRNGAPWVWVVPLLAVLTSSGLAAENYMLTGKPASWETWGEAPRQTPKPLQNGEALETPNQARRRLGLSITESFPAQDYGVAEETPNQRRHRLDVEANQLAQVR